MVRSSFVCLSVAFAAATAAGCNTLTGVNDLEEVPCFDCVDSAFDGSVEDTAAPEAAPPSDTNADTNTADTNTADAKTDTGCTINRDCDDKNDCTRDTCEADAGTCSSTTVDEDGDGESPSALGACGLDCDDSNKDVFSKQTAFFSTSYLNAVGVGSYDYDCNGVEEKQRDATYKCLYAGAGKCTFTEGWSGTVPACGATGTYITGCVYSSIGSCLPTGAKSKQACR